MGRLLFPDLFPLSSFSSSFSPPSFDFRCPLLNVSRCQASENSPRFRLLVYNPLPRPRSFELRLPFRGGRRVRVRSYPGGSAVPVEMAEVAARTAALLERRHGRGSAAEVEALFKVHNVPPLGGWTQSVVLWDRM